MLPKPNRQAVPSPEYLTHQGVSGHTRQPNLCEQLVSAHGRRTDFADD